MYAVFLTYDACMHICQAHVVLTTMCSLNSALVRLPSTVRLLHRVLTQPIITKAFLHTAHLLAQHVAVAAAPSSLQPSVASHQSGT